MSKSDIACNARQSMGQHLMEYSILIPIHHFVDFEFSVAEQALIDKSKESGSATDFAKTLTMIVEKIEETTSRKTEHAISNSFGDIEKMYVDHMVQNLETKPISEIVIFLSKYCGWDRIKSYMEKKLKELENGKG